MKMSVKGQMHAKIPSYKWCKENENWFYEYTYPVIVVANGASASVSPDTFRGCIFVNGTQFM